MLRLVDTHCHVNFQAFDKDWKEVVEKTLKAGVDMLVVGTDLKTSQKAIDIAKNYSGVHAAVGLHPIHVLDRDWRSEILKISQLIASPQVVAIGEIGFDRHRMPENDLDSIIKTQETVFDFFIEEAAKAKKPIILHNRGAWDCLEKKLPQFKKLSLTGVQHCFPESLKEAEQLFSIGFKVGFNGLVTYNNQWDKIIEEISLENILIETDSPYLTPVPHRGERNEPGLVKYIAEYIAKIKGINLETVIDQTTKNAEALFGVKI